MRAAKIRVDPMVYNILPCKDLCDQVSAVHARGRKGR